MEREISLVYGWVHVFFKPVDLNEALLLIHERD
jgi:hypothetical protein